jgi:hypothetical protein
MHEIKTAGNSRCNSSSKKRLTV